MSNYINEANSCLGIANEFFKNIDASPAKKELLTRHCCNQLHDAILFYIKGVYEIYNHDVSKFYRLSELIEEVKKIQNTLTPMLIDIFMMLNDKMKILDSWSPSAKGQFSASEEDIFEMFIICGKFKALIREAQES